jgi:cytidylate kinase
MRRINIAIDGHSSCGKSTMARQLAAELGYTYVDSGAMYRAVTLYVLRKGLIADGVVDTVRLIHALPRIKVNFSLGADGAQHTHLNGEDVEEAIRQMDVSRAVSAVSSIKEVRSLMRGAQQQMGAQGGVVMDGRDIGTAVFPLAELKIFMTASDTVRAQRRLDELVAKGHSVTMNEVLTNLRERDRIDSTRTEDPLRQAPDALVLDNSNLSPAQQLSAAKAWALKAIEG